MENNEEAVYIRIWGGEEEEENNKKREFKQFDIILTVDDDDEDDNNDNNSIKDHCFHKQTNLYSSRTSKRIMQEWNNLNKNLPDSIFVRVYEGRIDLLRAVIIGPAGTPYHDALFFFDIQFLPHYPFVHPKVIYKSFGFRLNPNLYRDAILCYPLLNILTGEKKVKWSPSQSSVLQLLVSLQAIFRTNTSEGGNYLPNAISGGFGEKDSTAYNEEAPLLSGRAMLAVLNNPPSHFEEFVAQHFRERAETILEACKTYIADHSKDNSGSSSSLASSMRSVYPKLVQAFIKNGSSLENYERDTKYMDDNLGYNKYKQVLLMMFYSTPLLCILLFYFWVFVTILMMCYENVYLKK